MTKWVSAEGPTASSMSAEPILGRPGVTPAGEWTQLTGKDSMPSPPGRAEATADDARAFPTIKEEAFDEDGRIKPDFQSRFMPALRLAWKNGTTLRDDEPGETQSYNTYDVIDLLEVWHNYFSEAFEVGVSILREHYQVLDLPQ